LRLRDLVPDYKSPCRTDVDRTEVLQLFCEPGRPEGPVTADVDAAEKNDMSHGLPASTWPGCIRPRSWPGRRAARCRRGRRCR
jgi:hypothetical protein